MTINENTNYFRLFAHCIPVNGAEESVLYDLTRGRSKFIPNLLFEILELSNNTTIAKIKEHYNHEEDEGIDAYVKMFIEEEWAFYTDEPECFPKLDLYWDTPSFITNAILECSEHSTYNLLDAITQLHELGCHSIEIRNFDFFSFEKINEILKHINESRINAVYFNLKYNDELSEENLSSLIGYGKDNTRLRSLLVHSSPFNKAIEHESRYFDKLIRYTRNILTASTKEIEDPRFFAVNIPAFTEAQQHNLGLNRKVSVTASGEIKHYPDHATVFGDIKKDKIKDIIQQEAFQHIWKISKDKIEICKDCEYRYVCVDNTEIIEKEEKLYRLHPCAYDPYTNTWANEKKELLSEA